MVQAQDAPGQLLDALFRQRFDGAFQRVCEKRRLVDAAPDERGGRIECDGVRGKVKNINYQSTLVETNDGSVIAFLNSQLFTKNFKNMTRNHGYEMAKITVGVAYGSEIDKVRKMIIERISKLNCYDPNKGVQVLFQNFGESSVDLLVVVWVRVFSQVADIALVKENIYAVLNENGIEIPFPQTDLHIRTSVVPTP